MKYLKKFNESKFYTIERLPQEAQVQLSEIYDVTHDTVVEVYPDPKVDGTYAVRVHRDDLTFDLLWYKGGFDEISSDENEYGFKSWPPFSGDLKFFI
jgi:GTP cyclohydrolase II